MFLPCVSTPRCELRSNCVYSIKTVLHFANSKWRKRIFGGEDWALILLSNNFFKCDHVRIRTQISRCMKQSAKNWGWRKGWNLHAIKQLTNSVSWIYWRTINMRIQFPWFFAEFSFSEKSCFRMWKTQLEMRIVVKLINIVSMCASK